MDRLKNFLFRSLGTVGYILYFLISGFFLFFPLFYINIQYIWGILSGVLMVFFPPSSIVFWIWGLIETINGFTTGLGAILYYIFFAIGWIPYFVFNVIVPFVNFIIIKCTPIPKYRRDPRWLGSEPLASDIHPFFYIGQYDADTMEQSIKNEIGWAYEWSLKIMGIDWTTNNFPAELDATDIAFIRDNTFYAAKLPERSSEKAVVLAEICKHVQAKIPKIAHSEWYKFIKTSLFLDPILKKPTYKL